ncbi:MAG: T9SS type A sorting domain-containing protein [Chitinophagaceae bacterium]
MKTVKKLLLALLCMASMHSYAQVDSPQYAFSPNGNINGSLYVGGEMEVIYYPSDFPTMPGGMITSVYVRAGRITNRYSEYKYYGYRVSMKQTEISKYPHGGAVRVMDTFIIMPNEGIVAKYPLFIIPGGIKDREWIKIPLNVANFSYSGKQNLVVQVHFDTAVMSTFPLDVVKQTYPDYRIITPMKDSIRGMSQINLVNMGFDVAVTGVAGIKNLQSIGVFPNPSSGRFQLSFQSAAAVKVAHISVANASGRRVYEHSYTNVGVSFFKEVNLEGLPKGIYFLKLDADGEVIKRQVVLE